MDENQAGDSAYSKRKKNINKHGLLKFTRTQETIFGPFGLYYYNSKNCNRIVTTFLFSFRVLEF